MAKITDGTFRDWQDTEVINAVDYKQERDMLRVAVNDNDTRLGSLEASATGLLLGNVQASKITSDTGGVMLTTASTSDDILQIIVDAGVGLRTFYAVSGSKNLPPTNISIRGMAHMTESGIVWVQATDYRNNVYTNYRDSGGWKGWRHLVSNEDTQEELWAGAIYLQEGQTVTPSKKLSECRNGWVLVWSDYNPGIGVGNYDIVETFITKGAVSKFPGAGRPITIGRTPDSSIIKYVNIGDTKLEGNAGNEVGDKNDVVLRYVLEW
ncbi:MAG: hypothetical protein ACJ8MO_42285 [Bacillus sp. (in: firmicutes)]